ncbi:hypothetical protein OB69_01455 [Roseivirga seohaensis subsp. aquiponti]|uniref:Uncharacterized protein n=1 Tax=Roseivirga seohaensis subsp. aquiponti TaxID=1566026 RepID=A0A0L8APW8_9BACT|nr:hypothetical protein OB69_01455 [Roseivirga seohaensis subsp. aquiponti]
MKWLIVFLSVVFLELLRESFLSKNSENKKLKVATVVLFAILSSILILYLIEGFYIVLIVEFSILILAFLSVRRIVYSKPA